jgi:hypothetical protein
MRWSCLLALTLLLSVSGAALAEGPVEDLAEWFASPTDEGAVDRLSLHADYLYWWLRRLRTPPLLTAGSEGSSALLGDANTLVLRGGDRITSRHERYVGIRPGADWWLDTMHTWALEADAFFLERDSTNRTVRSGEVPVLALPFVDEHGRNHSFVVNGFNPEFGDLSGGTNVYSRMELFGQEANVRYQLACSSESEGDLFAGARFLQLRERLDLTSSAKFLPEGSTLIGLEDHFQTFDKFYGGQLGASGKLRLGRLALEGRAALALGADEQTIRNKGQSIFHTPQQRSVQPYGLFVLPSNRGAFSRVSFDVVTEVRLNLVFELASHVRLRGGYSFLTWDGPVRPGDQILPINRSQVRPGGLAGPLQPLPNFKEDFFWAHGFAAGVELSW